MIKVIYDKYKVDSNGVEMLAKEYDVKASCIKDIVNRKSWKHI